MFGYTYQIKYTTYTTNYSPDGYCELDSICFGDGTNGALKRINGPSVFCTAPAHDGASLSARIKINEYVTTHAYPGPGNYIICFEQANRNAGIMNMVTSANQTMAFESLLVIPTLTSGKNDSPTFAEHAVAPGCLNNSCFNYNPIAIETDGDSLSYKLAPSASGTGTNTSGYSYPYSGTGGTFSINPATGTLTWCNPQYAGDYNVGIKVEEWRMNDDGDYFLIGYVIRDTQFTIDYCTGINDIFKKDQTITIYPNPVTDQVEIKFNEAGDELYTIDLTDVSGKTVTRFLENSSVKSSMKFDMRGFSNGIYFVKITGSHKTTVKKLIKQ